MQKYIVYGVLIRDMDDSNLLKCKLIFVHFKAAGNRPKLISKFNTMYNSKKRYDCDLKIEVDKLGPSLILR